MIKSMTGFGQGIFESESCRITVDIRTVNNRFLDIHAKLPLELAAVEAKVKKRVQSVLKRGRIDIIATIVQTAEVGYELNLPLIRGYWAALQRVQQELDITPGSVDLGLFTRLPGALQPVTTLATTDTTVSTGVMLALDQALSTLLEMRSAEGNELSNELKMRLGLIEGQLPSVEAVADQALHLYRERLQKRVEELLHDSVQIDESRLAQEVAYLAERSDITEEIARLKSHILQFYEILEAGEEIGKKLDFLLQEMNREINTILSKSSELSISRVAIEIKSEIEKLREQVQNVE